MLFPLISVTLVALSNLKKKSVLPSLLRNTATFLVAK